MYGEGGTISRRCTRTCIYRSFFVSLVSLQVVSSLTWQEHEPATSSRGLAVREYGPFGSLQGGLGVSQPGCLSTCMSDAFPTATFRPTTS